MATKKAEKRQSVTTAEALDGIASVLASFAAVIGNNTDGMDKLFYVENIADNVGTLATEVGNMSNAVAAMVIAQHGTKDDRERVVAYLKRWFSDGVFEE